MKSDAFKLSFKDLLELVRQLPTKDKEILQAEIKSELTKEPHSKKDLMSKLLLLGPTVSKEELNEMEKARTDLNQWRNRSA